MAAYSTVGVGTEGAGPLAVIGRRPQAPLGPVRRTVREVRVVHPAG